MLLIAASSDLVCLQSDEQTVVGHRKKQFRHEADGSIARSDIPKQSQ